MKPGDSPISPGGSPISPGGSPILKVEELVVEFDTDQGGVRAVDGVGFQLDAGTTLGVAGESGCGKSVTALSIMRLLPKPVSRIESGQIRFRDRDLLNIPIRDMQTIRGRKIAMIFQEPMTALNPVQSVGLQMMEVFTLHFPDMGYGEKQEAARRLLDRVGIPDPGRVLKKYPHELSGGMRQRVMIATALSCSPDILIADEPTTALDVTVQAQILDLIRELRESANMSVILITHDLGVIAENCDRVVVMYAGRVAETADVRDLFNDPLHPYTRGLLTSIPSRAKKAKTLLPTIQGNVPPLSDMPEGCRFADRCPQAEPFCWQVVPEEREAGPDRTVACHLA